MTYVDENRISMERTLECFRGFTDCLDGDNEKEGWQIGDIKKQKRCQNHMK